MATDHKTSNVLSELAESSPIENELPTYRAISTRAVLSALCGILSLFSIANPFFYIFAYWRSCSASPPIGTSSAIRIC